MQTNIEILKRDILSRLNLKTWAEANTYFCRNRAFDKWPKWCLFLEKSCNQEKDYGAEQKQCLTYKGKKKKIEFK